MRELRTLAAALVLAATTGACGGAGGGGGPDASFAMCPNVSSDSSGEPIALEVGLLDDQEEFTPLSEGQDAPLVLGVQGLYMLLLEFRAPLPVSAEKVCMNYGVEMGPSGSFSGITTEGIVRFSQVTADDFSGELTIIVGSAAESDALDGAEVDLAATMDGEGYSGALQRRLRLVVPQQP